MALVIKITGHNSPEPDGNLIVPSPLQQDTGHELLFPLASSGLLQQRK